MLNANEILPMSSVDTDVDDDNFVSDSSASDGESERDNSDVKEVSNEEEEVRNTQLRCFVYSW